MPDNSCHMNRCSRASGQRSVIKALPKAQATAQKASSGIFKPPPNLNGSSLVPASLTADLILALSLNSTACIPSSGQQVEAMPKLCICCCSTEPRSTAQTR